MKTQSKVLWAIPLSILLSGLSCYAALAVTVGRAPAIKPVVPANLAAATRVSAPATALTGMRAVTPTLPALAPLSRQALAGTQAALMPAAPAAQAESVSLMQGLSLAFPEFEKMAVSDQKSAAAEDFAARLCAPESLAPVYPEDPSAPVEIIVTVPEGLGGVQDIDRSQNQELWALKQVSQIGISQSDMALFQASLFGAVGKINTIIFNAPRKNSKDFIGFLTSKGYEARLGEIIPKPKPVDTSHLMARTVGLKEMASIIGADKLQNELKKVLGEPQAPKADTAQNLSWGAAAVKWVKNTFQKIVLGAPVKNPDLPWALLDGFSWINHPFMKGHFTKEVDNINDGDSHGSHTGGTVVAMDIFNYNGRAYNIFPRGSATEGDILMKMNAAQKDGALATTNSWGEGRGNPKDKISQLFIKLAQDGMHHSISAGNSGSGANTIGGPAIAYYNVPLVINGKTVGQVKRIKAIAAADADKKTAYFSSRGPGSATTSRNPSQFPNYPMKPDETGVGVNLVAPTPTGSQIPELGGPGQSMSGTSMSNPGVFGAFLLLTRGIMVLLADYLPKLPEAELKVFAMDVARFAMTQTAQKLVKPEEQGDGFINVWDAFEFSAKLLKDNAAASFGHSMRDNIKRALGFWAPQA